MARNGVWQGRVTPTAMQSRGEFGRGWVLGRVTACAMAAMLAAPGSVNAQAGPQLLSTTSSGQLAQGGSYNPVASADGRFVAFTSNATNLTSLDTNGTWDVFVKDLSSGTVTCVSVTPLGQAGNGESSSPAISADGRFVAFSSDSSDLLPGDTNGFADVFVHDRVTGLLERASVNSVGREADLPCYVPAISGDGRYVAFESYSKTLVLATNPGIREIFVRDRLTGQTFIASHGIGDQVSNGSSGNVAFSLDGSRLAFDSWATNLVPFDGNPSPDVFVYDLDDGEIHLVSVPDGGGVATSSSAHARLSADGRLVTFQSNAKNLVVGDFNLASDCFVHDLETGSTRRVSLTSAGLEGNNHSSRPVISGDGRYVVFHSDADDLVAGDTNVQQDVFVHDQRSGQTVRVSTDAVGVQGGKLSSQPSIAAASGHIVFESWAENFFHGDVNQAPDVFVRPLAELLGDDR